MQESPEQAIERYLRSGDYDAGFHVWPGDNCIASARYGNVSLRKALISAVQCRTQTVTQSDAPAEMDVGAFTHEKVAQMVKGLFPPHERDVIHDVLGHSVVILSPATIGVVMAAFAGATFAVRLTMPAFARRVREWSVIRAALLVAGASFLLFPLGRSLGTLMSLSFVLGLGLGCAQPMIMALLYAASPPGRQGEVVGVRTMMLSTSSTLLPLVFGALGAALGMAPVFLAMAAGLIGALSAYFGLPAWHFLPGRGATDLLFLFPRVLRPRRALLVTPCFSEYERSLLQTGTTIDFSPLSSTERLRLAPARLLHRLEPETDLIVLANPGNPTGVAIPRQALIDIVQGAREQPLGLVDGSHIHFCPSRSVLSLLT